MFAVTARRRTLLAAASAAYALVFAAAILVQRPALGIGHLFYLAIVLVALALGTPGGLAGGLVASVLYTLAMVVSRGSGSDVITAATAIRALTFCGVGAVVGRFASANRRLVAQLQELATRDFLTGAANVRVFDEELGERCARGRSFVLVLGDMDELKWINDHEGHLAGNAAIRRVADGLRSHLRESDRLARIGGDEFALLLEGVVDAATLCARLRNSLAEDGLGITFGWAAAPVDGFDPIQLFRKADERLYAAKLARGTQRAAA
jgi:diguanylate cyclase (GGDEF)-like protein